MNYLETLKDLVMKGPTMQDTVMNAYWHGFYESLGVGLTYYAVTGDEVNALGVSFVDGMLRSLQAALYLDSSVKKLAKENAELREKYENLVSDLERDHVDELTEDLKGQPLRAARQADETLARHEDGLAKFMSGGSE